MECAQERVDWMNVLDDAIQDESIDPELSILEKLSPELILQILSHLSWSEALAAAPVCLVFRDLLRSASLWAKFRYLDFTDCAVPLPNRILHVVSRCPATETLKIGEVIAEEFVDTDDAPLGECLEIMNNEILQDMEEANENDEMEQDDAEAAPARAPLSSYNRFISKIIQQCPHLKDLSLESLSISHETVQSLSKQLPLLTALTLERAERLLSSTIEKLIDQTTALETLTISRCNLHNPRIKRPNGEPLTLTSLNLIRCGVRDVDVAAIAQNCPHLKNLDLSESTVIDVFGPPVVRTSDFRCLEHLKLMYCRDLAEVILEDLPQLRSIDTSRADFLHFVKLKCPKLNDIKIDGCTGLAMLVVHSDVLETLSLAPLLPVLQAMDVKCPNLNHLELQNCTRLQRDQIAGIDGLSHVKRVNMNCLRISLDDLHNEISPKLLSVEEMLLEGFTSSSLKVASETLKTLEVKELKYTAELKLETPQLTKLNLENLRVLPEDELVENIPETIQELNLRSVSGLHGSLLSTKQDKFHNITTLQIRDSRFVKMLNLVEWPNLISVSIGSCPHLKQVTVRCAAVKTISLWWLSLDNLTIDAPRVDHLDLKGCDFQYFHLYGQSLQTLEVAGLCSNFNLTGSAFDIRCPVMKHLQIGRSRFLASEDVDKLQDSCPSVTNFHIMGCPEIRSIAVGRNMRILRLAGLSHLTDIVMHPDCKLEDLAFSGLPKLDIGCRDKILKTQSGCLKTLQLRLGNEECSYCIEYPNVTHLSVDQGLHLNSLDIKCPKLATLRIKGCPYLSQLRLEVEDVSSLDVSRSMPLNALKSLHLSSTSVRRLTKFLSQYCPSLQKLHIDVRSVSLAQVVGFGLHHRNLKEVVIGARATRDAELESLFPDSFSVPHHILDRPWNKDLQVIFSGH